MLKGKTPCQASWRARKTWRGLWLLCSSAESKRECRRHWKINFGYYGSHQHRERTTAYEADILPHFCHVSNKATTSWLFKAKWLHWSRKIYINWYDSVTQCPPSDRGQALSRLALQSSTTPGMRRSCRSPGLREYALICLSIIVYFTSLHMYIRLSLFGFWTSVVHYLLPTLILMYRLITTRKTAHASFGIWTHTTAWQLGALTIQLRLVNNDFCYYWLYDSYYC